MEWDLLGKAFDFYAKNFQYMDVPWVVRRDTALETMPENASTTLWTCIPGVLVGSGEQGFLEKLPLDGRFYTITPCFRDEAVIDRYHQHYFMKLELFSSNTDQEEFDWMVFEAAQFMTTLVESVGSKPVLHKRCTGPETCDLEIGGVEVGSYGIRQTSHQNYLYGTGLALPRFTEAVKDAEVKREGS